MEYAINKILKLAKSIQINYNQALYLLSLKFNPNEIVIINNVDILKLIELELVQSNKLTVTGENLLNVILKDDIKSIDNSDKYLYPKISSESGVIIKDLAKVFLKDRLDEKEYTRLSLHIKNPVQVPFFFLFLELFPTADKNKNKVWDEHFQTEWDNVTLKRISPGSVKKFEQIWKFKDIGLFLLGTYMFIASSRNEKTNKYFIKSLENYFKEYEHWYNLAGEKIEDYSKANISKQKESIYKTNTNVL
jgi:hypothetical protein